jgi:penicillin-binding protein A
MQSQIRKLGVGLVVAFLAVFLQLNYIQIFAAESIASNNANIRQLIREYSIKRGDILTVDGQVLARSRPRRGRFEFQRTYPGGERYGHVTGYYSLRYGTARIEGSYNDELLGDTGVVSIQEIQDSFSGDGEQGDDVRLTVDSRLQEAAQSALGGQRGAVVAIDPNNGEVRAMWSNPSFDPTGLATFESRRAKAYWESLDPRSGESALINLATSRGYPPGSTMKVVTAAAALESGRYNPQSTFEDPQALEPCSQSDPPCMPLTNQSLTNFTRTSCTGAGRIDFFTALTISCDTTFAIIGLQIHDEVHAMAEKLGFNDNIPYDVATEPSAFPRIEDDNAPFRAYEAIGQGDVVATPLQMALVAAAVANDGVVPRPRLVREIISPSGGIVERFSSETLGRAMSGDTAEELSRMMVSVVQDPSGTGTAATMPGVEVAGKTGTAQTGVEGESPHTWFISFAPADDPQLAVAVIVENGGTFGSEATGGAVAAPIAKAVMEADRQIRRW